MHAWYGELKSTQNVLMAQAHEIEGTTPCAVSKGNKTKLIADSKQQTHHDYNNDLSETRARQMLPAKQNKAYIAVRSICCNSTPQQP